MKRLLPLSFLLLTGCPSFDRVEYILQLDRHEAVFVWHDLRGSDSGDFNSILDDFVFGDKASEEFPRATVVSRRLVPHGEELDFRLDLRFETPDDIGILPGDATHPYRFCAPDGLMVSAAANALRDADHCVLFGKDTTVLHLEAKRVEGLHDTTMLPYYRKWALFKPRQIK